ncbi:guanine nucleotide-binding protein subunit beta-like protein 1 isoform X4 [Rissa tridactyla]|uniref:guanine nucleotide-binding protein subunit beta-like protein 1 isoform X4 n=1 Tax=Rissa tridactyla TaxID=75485 RepID=UPI0023BAAD4D|nr:guanine nucleotide-binding protein subunit beta-like protein 1 isoform X4 [Rissa tridactyla]
MLSVKGGTGTLANGHGSQSPGGAAGGLSCAGVLKTPLVLLNAVKGEQESFWGANGQEVCHRVEVLVFHLKLKSCLVQVLELPSKTSVCTLKPEVGAKLGMPMCLKLWQPSCGSQPLLLAGYEDGSVVLWNMSMGKALSQLVCHQEPVMSLDFDSEKAKGISGSSEKVLSIWSLNEQQNLQVYKTHKLVNAGICDITIRPDKKILATGGWDHRIRIFGWKNLKPLAVLDYHTASVHAVSFSDHKIPSERLLAAGSKDHRISIWSIYTQT